jgi:uncharacterized membrane protein YphA (DoxX/SURF4 family)
MLATLLIRVLRVLLALTFAASASGKLDPRGNIAEAFTRWGYPIPMMMAIGVVEMLASIALLVPRFTTPACAVLALTMVGSIVTHFTNFDEMGWPLLPVALIALLAVVWRYGRSPKSGRPRAVTS